MKGMEISMGLDHTNVTGFVRAAKSDHTLYIFEELATGGDLWTMATPPRSLHRD